MISKTSIQNPKHDLKLLNINLLNLIMKDNTKDYYREYVYGTDKFKEYIKSIENEHGTIGILDFIITFIISDLEGFKLEELIYKISNILNNKS